MGRNETALKEPNPLNQVAEFLRTFKHPIKEKPGIQSLERCNFRVSLLMEDVQELSSQLKTEIWLKSQMPYGTINTFYRVTVKRWGDSLLDK
ncbi:hypothetical protein [Pedobacter sp. JCM 36344]|uniref:hypothetical protein n=1 Tax=Pedobacter sp. JCM 36344 TaxID=3374280 RepID=UPI00397A3569